MIDPKAMTAKEAIEIVKRRIQEGYPTRLSLRRELAHALATLEALAEENAALDKPVLDCKTGKAVGRAK